MVVSSRLRLFCLMVIVSSISACSAVKQQESNYSIEQANTEISAVDLKALQSLSVISSKLAEHRTVFVGESHTNYADHLNQLSIIKQLHKHWGNQTSIGLEMIQQPYQAFLDKYIASEINESQMLKGTEWYDRWKFEFRLYRPIFDYAKQNKIPLVALNIPKELTKRISKVGISGLSKEERKQLPRMIDRTNKAYEKRITEVFSGHSHTNSKNTKKFIDAQLGWDEGMAFSAAKYLIKNPNKHMVIIAGSGHVINYEGIPDRLDRQIKSKSAVVLNNFGGDRNEKSGDYILLSEKRKLPPIGRFGIGMKAAKVKGSGVIVSIVDKKSAAKKAGVQVGDLIIQLNDQAIADMVDFKIFAEATKPGSKINIKVKRQQKILILPAVLKRKIPSFAFLRSQK